MSNSFLVSSALLNSIDLFKNKFWRNDNPLKYTYVYKYMEFMSVILTRNA